MSHAERTMRELGHTLDDVREQIMEHTYTLIKALDLSESESEEDGGDEERGMGESDEPDGFLEPADRETLEARYMKQIEQMARGRKRSPEVVITREREKSPEVVDLVSDEESLEEGEIREDADKKNSKEIWKGEATDRDVPFGHFRFIAGDKVLATGTVFTNKESADKYLWSQKVTAIPQGRGPSDGKGIDSRKDGNEEQKVDKREGVNKGKGIDQGKHIDRRKHIDKGKHIDKSKAPIREEIADQSRSMGKGKATVQREGSDRRKSIDAGESMSYVEDLIKGEISEDMDEDMAIEDPCKLLTFKYLNEEGFLSERDSMAESTDTDADFEDTDTVTESENTETDDDEGGPNFLTSLSVRRGYINQDLIVAAVLWGLEDWPRYEILMETGEYETIAEAYLSLLHMLWIQVRALTEDVSPVEKFAKPDEAYTHNFLSRYSAGEI